MFNHKGGVSKTTTSYSLGWMLAKKGHTVLLVDADSQCNLTNIFLGEDGFEQFYIDEPDRNIKSGLAPAFGAKPVEIEPVTAVQANGNAKLYLLPGSFELSEYEVSLGVSFTLTETIITLKNLPGSFAFLIAKTAERLSADYVIIDMNPSLSAINQALLVSSDYFIVPTAPDNFSNMAVRSLAKVLPKWEKWAVRARSVFADAYYPLPQSTPRFLGTVVQGFNIRKGKPTLANREVIDRLNETVRTTLIDALAEPGMLLPDDKYKSEDYCLVQIPDFQSLNAAYQTYCVPVFALTDAQLRYVGTVLDQYKDTRTRFRKIYSEFADTVVRITRDA
ncbi:MAG: ParA family protein [Pirellulaceae bacterium]|nr:ParA family protein [Pirellulaceae bacterium]